MAENDTTTRSGQFLWWGVAALAIVVGFADLARGGETVAPILLALGYCVLIPIAILKGADGRRADG